MAIVSVHVTTKKEYQATFSARELRALIMGQSSRLPYDLPPTTTITIQVPRGGDYSGDVLDIDDVGGLTVRWTEEKTS